MNSEPSQKPEIIDISKKVNEFIKFSLIGFLLIFLFFWAGYLFINEIQDKADFCERNLSNIKYRSYRQGIYLRRTSTKLYNHFIFGEPVIEKEFAKYAGNTSNELTRAQIFYDLMRDVYPLWKNSGIFRWTEMKIQQMRIRKI